MAKAKGRNNLQRLGEVRAAVNYGIDVSMLIDNIRRSPTERIRRHQIALDTVERLKKTKRK